MQAWDGSPGGARPGASPRGWHARTGVPECDTRVDMTRQICGLPREEGVVVRVACQRQLRERESHHPPPAQKVLRSPHARGKPEHIVGEKATGMFLREPKRVALWHLLQGDRVI
jgi:hypothetical protein